jgi:hypothetical protein
MSDFLNKLIGVVLAFILLAAAPLIITSLGNDLTMKRSVLNETTNFINKVTDNARISDLDLSNFYLGISAYGVSMDGIVQRYVKVVNPDGNGGTYTTYTASDQLTSWNKGDIIKVTVKAIDYTGSQRIMNRIMHLSPPKYDVTMSGMVRN